MTIQASELKAYGAANHAEDDASTQGGAIATSKMVEFTDLAANDTLEVVSDNVADTMNITVTARNVGGAIVSQTIALNGTTVVPLTTLGTVERFEKAVLASAAAGTVTVRRASASPTVVAMPAGITEARRLFIDAASQAAQTVRYEKFFLKNTNATLTLTSAQVELLADPATTIMIGLATSVDDTVSVANRLTAPASVTFVDDGAQPNVPGSALAAGSAIGVWAQMTRAANAAAVKNTFTVQLSGTST